MELPHLGLHCGVESCSKLDFLPFECDCCHKTLCQDHRSYADHNCTDAYAKDVQVPVCPLCNQPITIKYGQDPNVRVNEHIMRDCQEQQKRKLYTNKCSFPGCKKKELVPVTCSTCHKNFCLKHRFEGDHECSRSCQSTVVPSSRSAKDYRGATGGGGRGGGGGGGGGGGKRPQASLMSQIGADLNRERQERLMKRESGSTSHHYSSSTTQQQQDEDEDLALALAISAQENKTPHPSHSTTTTSHTTSGTITNDTITIDEDEALARAIAASLNDTAPPKTTTATRTTTNTHSSNNNNSDKSNCVIS